jgi:hypothetical protein
MIWSSTSFDFTVRLSQVPAPRPALPDESFWKLWSRYQIHSIRDNALTFPFAHVTLFSLAEQPELIVFPLPLQTHCRVQLLGSLLLRFAMVGLHNLSIHSTPPEFTWVILQIATHASYGCTYPLKGTIHDFQMKSRAYDVTLGQAWP